MQALILAGGSGTRFWPLSRRQRPKQLLPLDGERSLLQATVDRLAPLVDPSGVWICTTEALADAVRGQLPEVPPHQVLAEPEGRNTAAAIGWALGCMPSEVRQGVVAVLPSDHRFADDAAFRDCLAQASRLAAEHDRIMTLGVTPSWAETGYGYLELGEEIELGARRVATFREKPDAVTAARYVDSGNYLWNAGIFVFRGQTLLGHLHDFEPELGRGLAAIIDDPERTHELYPQLPSTSIDFAVMERLTDLGTLPLDGGWSDLGSWKALHEVSIGDEHENRSMGDVIAIDAKDNLLYADIGTIAVLGVEGLVVVRTADTVLVMPRERSQDVRAIVDRLKSDQRSDLL